jgi:hypothetical protein
VVNFTPWPLYSQGKSPWYPLDRRLGRPQSRPGRGGEEKTSQPPLGIEPYTPRPLYSQGKSPWYSLDRRLGGRIVMVKQPVLVPPSFRDLLPQTLQNFQTVMLVHRLAWRNKFLVNNGLTVKKDHRHALHVRPNFPHV